MSMRAMAGVSGAMVCAAAAYGLTAGGGAVDQSEPPTVSAEQRVDATGAGTPTPAVLSPTVERAPECRFEEGQTVSYRIAVEDEVTVDVTRGIGAPANLGETTVTQTTGGVVDLKALGATDGQTRLLGRMREVESSGVRRTGELQKPFLVRVTDDCAVDGFAYFEQTGLPYARIQQAVMYELQWRWPTEEVEAYAGRNGQGTYRARVATRSEGGQTVVDRRIVDYEPWQTGEMEATDVDESMMTVRTGDGPWFERLEVGERLTGEHASARRRVTARRVPTMAGIFDGVPGQTSRYVWTDLLPKKLTVRERRAPTALELKARERVSHLTVDQAVDRFVGRVESDEVGIQDTWPELRTYLEARPGQTRMLVARLKTTEFSTDAQMAAYIALGNARTDQAKSALTGIMTDEQAPFVDRTRAMLALVDRADVGPTLAHYLSGIATRITNGQTKSERLLARQAMLAVGTMSGMRPGDPQLKDIAVAGIEAGIEANPHPINRRPVYGALANVGDPELLGLVREIPGHPDADMRKAASVVVRRMPPAKTAEFVGRWLDREQNWRVKNSLYRTIERQTFDAGEHPGERVLAHAIDDLKQKPGPMTRKALIRILGRGLAGMPSDDLGIEQALLEMIPYELEKRSGLYGLIAEQIQNGDKLRRAADDAVAQIQGQASGEEGPPRPPETRQRPQTGVTFQAGPSGKVRAQ